MPYKSEKIKVAGTVYDKRRKLTAEQVQAIKILNGQGYSQRLLASMFGCSKRSVQNILNPQKRSAPKPRPTSYWTEAKRRYRKRKQELFQSGKLYETKRKYQTPERSPKLREDRENS